MRLAPVLLAALSAVPALAQTPVLVGYLPQWGLYGTPPWSAQQLVTSGSAALLNQIDYSQAFVKDGRCVVADPNADVTHPYTAATSVDGTADAPDAPVLKGEFHQLQELHRRYPRIRMLISIEGKASLFADAAQPGKRAAFVSSCIDVFLRGHVAPGITARGLFTGIDVDWEYPNQPGDGANYNALMVEFRKQLEAYGAETKTHPMLTVAAAPGLGRYPGVDWKLVAANVDQIGLMNYDYNGPWQKITGIVAPLYPIPGVRLESGSIDGTVAEYENAGAPAAKLLVGVPFYGYHWSGVADPGRQHGLGMSAKPESGDTPYHEIAGLPGADTPFRDPHSAAPWIFRDGTFWTFDDATSVRAKAEYTVSHGLGGMMIWELSGDTADGSLLKAMKQGLAQPGPAAGVAGSGAAQ